MAADIGTRVSSNILDLLIQVTPEDPKDRNWKWSTEYVNKLDTDLLRVLNTDFNRVKGLLIHVINQFQARQKRLPPPVERCLERIGAPLREAIHLIDDAKRQQDRGGFLPGRREGSVSSKNRVWKARFDALLQEFQTVFSTSANSEQIVSSAARLLQPVPDSGFVGSGIQSNREKLQKWLGETGREARVIGVYGTAGVGKTSLLKIIYNSYKKEVSRFFDVVIWLTMSQKYEIEQLQGSIAEALNLTLEETANAEAKKMKLSESLGRRKVLLILDNVRQEIDLNEAGVKIEDANGSKLLISSRNREVIVKMGANECSLLINPLSSEEGCELFMRGTSKNGAIPENIREDTAKEIAKDCEGLPLAINAVAAAMSFKKTPEEWKGALDSMRSKDLPVPTDDGTINAELYRPVPTDDGTINAELYRLLKWTYNELSDGRAKVCFLTCAAFREDKEIAVDTLVGMWDAEGLLNPAKTSDSTEGLQNRTETTDLMDAGRQIINVLVSRCLVEYVKPIVDDDYHSVEYVKIHEVFRDIAIDIGQRDEICLFEAGQKLQEFPTRVPKECRRISVAHNAIRNLPNDLNCEGLQSLVLASNIPLEKVPDGFFSNVPSLKVLDLSCTSITTLPKLEQLKQLQFLNLSSCSKLVDLPDSICSVLSLKGLDLSRTSIRKLPGNLLKLSGLQVLNLNSCSELQTLPDKIVELKSLKHLKLDACFRLEKIPEKLSQLTSLDTLILPLMESTCAMSVKDLSNLSNLVELTTVVKSDNADMKPWSKMRNLTLEYEDEENADRVEVAQSEHVILQNMRNMEELQNFHLINYQGGTLPNSICKLQKMKLLLLRSCYHLEELFALDQIRGESAGGSSQSEALLALDQSRSEVAGDSSQSEGFPPALDQSRSEVAGDSSQSEALPALDQSRSEVAGDSSQSEGFPPALDQSRSEVAGDSSQSEALPALDQSRSEVAGDSSQSAGRVGIWEKFHLTVSTIYTHVLQVALLEKFRLTVSTIYTHVLQVALFFMTFCKKCRQYRSEVAGGSSQSEALPALDQSRSEVAGDSFQSEALPALDQNRSESAGGSSQSEALPALDQSRSEGAGGSTQSEALPALDQSRSESAGDSFPMLEKLVLKHLLKLQRIAGPSAVWTMSKLQLLVIINCPLLQSFPEGMKLPELKELHMTMCNEFMVLDIGSGGFPMLELLALDELNKLQSIAGPGPGPSEWNEGTISKLQIVEIIDCPSLKTLPVGMEKLPSLKQINGELDWWERLTWKNDEIKIRLSQLFMII